MSRPALSLSAFSSLGEFSAYSFDEPPLVRNGQFSDLAPGETAVVYQQEGRFKYERFSIFLTKAKES